jgi:hypothetical protein
VDPVNHVLHRLQGPGLLWQKYPTPARKGELDGAVSRRLVWYHSGQNKVWAKYRAR